MRRANLPKCIPKPHKKKLPEKYIAWFCVPFRQYCLVYFVNTGDPRGIVSLPPWFLRIW